MADRKKRRIVKSEDCCDGNSDATKSESFPTPEDGSPSMAENAATANPIGGSYSARPEDCPSTAIDPATSGLRSIKKEEGVDSIAMDSDPGISSDFPPTTTSAATFARHEAAVKTEDDDGIDTATFGRRSIKKEEDVDSTTMDTNPGRSSDSPPATMSSATFERHEAVVKTEYDDTNGSGIKNDTLSAAYQERRFSASSNTKEESPDRQKSSDCSCAAIDTVACGQNDRAARSTKSEESCDFLPSPDGCPSVAIDAAAVGQGHPATSSRSQKRKRGIQSDQAPAPALPPPNSKARARMRARIATIKTYEENVVGIVNYVLSLLSIKEMTKEEIAGAFSVDVMNLTNILKKNVKKLKNGLRQVFKKTEQKEYTIMEDTPNRIECLGRDKGIFVLFVVLKFDTSKVHEHLKLKLEEALHPIAEYDKQSKMYQLKQMAVYDAKDKKLWANTKRQQLRWGRHMVEQARRGSGKKHKQTVVQALMHKMWPEATKVQLIGVGEVRQDRP